MSNSDFDPVLGRVASGVYILTVGTGERATGMLASWVVQAGFDPPMVSVAVKSGRYVEEWLTAGEPFVLNVLAEKQFDFLKHFGSGFDIDEPAFEGLAISHCPRGVPILSDGLGYLECEPTAHVDSGDHRIFLAKVVRGGLHSDKHPDAGPMTHIRKTGKHY